MLPPTIHTLGQLEPFPDVAAALAGSPPEPLQPISPTFEETARRQVGRAPRRHPRIRMVVIPAHRRLTSRR